MWKSIVPKEYPNGAVVFCSEELKEIFHPPTPLRGRVYHCGGQFKTSIIQNAIDTQLGLVYGLIAVDGSDAAFGKAQGLDTSVTSGPVISELGCLSAHIAGRTRRGGQSALRYSRLRDEAELAFLRKVAERAVALLTDVSGVVIAGKADMKHKLLAELPEHVQKQVICTVDLPCNAGAEALRQAAFRAAEAVTFEGQFGVDRELQHFFELTLRESLCCYGEAQTLRALEMGAVEHLLVSADVQAKLTFDDWRDIAASHGTHVVKIHPSTEQASRFCQSFGVGGCLRWSVEAHLLEGDEGNGEEHSDRLSDASGESSLTGEGILVPDKPAASLAILEEVDCETTNTTGVAGMERSHRETLAWFQAELYDAIGDMSAAEAITACVEVVLIDELSSSDEIAENVVGIICAEGGSEELALELIRRW